MKIFNFNKLKTSTSFLRVNTEIQWKESTTGKPTRTNKVTGSAMAMAMFCILDLMITGKTLFMKETLLTIKDMDSELCL